MSKNKILGIISRSFLVIIIVLAAYFLLNFSIPLLYPFLIGWMIAMLMEPIIKWLERKCRIPRLLGSFLVLFFLLSILLTAVIFLIAGIVVELTNLAQKLPSFFNDLGQLLFEKFVQQNTFLNHILDIIQNYLQKNPSQQASIQASIQDNISALTKQGTMLITDIISGIGSFLSNLPYLITVLVFITLATFFISLKWPRMHANIDNIVPDVIQKTGGTVMHDLKKALVGFIGAQLTLITISSFIMYIGLLILKVPYAISIALVIGAVDLLPYLGVGAVLVPWIIYLIFVGNIQLAIGLSIVYLIILITRQIIEPKLVATSIGLDPLVTLIALFIGLNLLGILGFIVGPAAAVIVIALHKAHIFQDIFHYIINGKKQQI